MPGSLCRVILGYGRVSVCTLVRHDRCEDIQYKVRS